MLDYAREVCQSCGNLRSVCSSPQAVWYPQRSVCYATATRELVQRKLREKHKKNDPSPKDYHPLDGVAVWVSQHDLTPEDDFL